MKRKKLIMTGVVVLALIVGIYIGNKIDFDELKNSSGSLNKKALAVYLEGDEGEYVLSSSNKFPTDGYVLNTEKSTCTNGGTLSQNAETRAISMSTSNKSECNLYFEKEQAKGPAESILAKANDPSITSYTSGNKGEMYTFTHPATKQTEALTDYRYIGANPNNYIDFNDETWRIIGVFTVETDNGKKQLIKIIRDESIGGLTWDMKSDKTYTNEWSTASLKTFLNGEYYNTDGSFTTTYYNYSGTAQTLSIPKGLSSTARSQVANVKWYLGGPSIYKNLGGPDYYAFERGTANCATTGNCSGQTRTTSIMQKVGLMYPSDYVYTYANGVDNTCYTDGYNCNTGTPANGWLFNSSAVQWALSPYPSGAFSVFAVSSYGLVNYSATVNTATCAVRPTVYLSSDVAIVDGDGSQSNPYKLSN